MTAYEACPACQDTGVTPDCAMCGGEGYIEEPLDFGALAEFDDEEDGRSEAHH